MKPFLVTKASMASINSLLGSPPSLKFAFVQAYKNETSPFLGKKRLNLMSPNFCEKLKIAQIATDNRIAPVENSVAQVSGFIDKFRVSYELFV